MGVAFDSVILILKYFKYSLTNKFMRDVYFNTQVNLDHIFRIDRQESTVGTENEKGSGLGLVLCKEFVQKNGGEIWAKSNLNEGTSFFFTIPKAL